MRIGALNTDDKVLIIAEVGNNHEGDFERAKLLVARAAEAGADVVKFQTIRADNFCSRKNEPRYSTLKKFEFSDAQFRELAAVAQKHQIVFMSTPFDLPGVEFLSTIVPAFKVASGDIMFKQLLEAIGRTRKPVILSTGMSTLEEVKVARQTLLVAGALDVAVLHCSVAYPTPLAEANLSAIKTLAREFGGVVGYSDHTIGIDAAAYSVACGARIIEKHFTLDKQQSSFRDHQLSADPADLSALVKKVRELEQALGSGAKVPQATEAANLVPVRRSIVAGRDVQAGEIIKISDLTWMRPGSGFKPGEEGLVVGKRLMRSLERGEVIAAADLEE
jgi:N,N'-diacetyllegionaminate synthase